MTHENSPVRQPRLEREPQQEGPVGNVRRELFRDENAQRIGDEGANAPAGYLRREQRDNSPEDEERYGAGALPELVKGMMEDLDRDEAKTIQINAQKTLLDTFGKAREELEERISALRKEMEDLIQISTRKSKIFEQASSTIDMPRVIIPGKHRKECEVEAYRLRMRAILQLARPPEELPATANLVRYERWVKEIRAYFMLAQLTPEMSPEAARGYLSPSMKRHLRHKVEPDALWSVIDKVLREKVSQSKHTMESIRNDLLSCKRRYRDTIQEYLARLEVIAEDFPGSEVVRDIYVKEAFIRGHDPNSKLGKELIKHCTRPIDELVDKGREFEIYEKNLKTYGCSETTRASEVPSYGRRNFRTGRPMGRVFMIDNEEDRQYFDDADELDVENEIEENGNCFTQQEEQEFELDYPEDEEEEIEDEQINIGVNCFESDSDRRLEVYVSQQTSNTQAESPSIRLQAVASLTQPRSYILRRAVTRLNLKPEPVGFQEVIRSFGNEIVIRDFVSLFHLHDGMKIPLRAYIIALAPQNQVAELFLGGAAAKRVSKGNELKATGTSQYYGRPSATGMGTRYVPNHRRPYSGYRGGARGNRMRSPYSNERASRGNFQGPARGRSPFRSNGGFQRGRGGSPYTRNAERKNRVMFADQEMEKQEFNECYMVEANEQPTLSPKTPVDRNNRHQGPSLVADEWDDDWDEEEEGYDEHQPLERDDEVEKADEEDDQESKEISTAGDTSSEASARVTSPATVQNRNELMAPGGEAASTPVNTRDSIPIGRLGFFGDRQMVTRNMEKSMKDGTMYEQTPRAVKSRLRKMLIYPSVQGDHKWQLKKGNCDGRHRYIVTHLNEEEVKMIQEVVLGESNLMVRNGFIGVVNDDEFCKYGIWMESSGKKLCIAPVYRGASKENIHFSSEWVAAEVTDRQLSPLRRPSPGRVLQTGKDVSVQLINCSEEALSTDVFAFAMVGQAVFLFDTGASSNLVDEQWLTERKIMWSCGADPIRTVRGLGGSPVPIIGRTILPIMGVALLFEVVDRRDVSVDFPIIGKPGLFALGAVIYYTDEPCIVLTACGNTTVKFANAASQVPACWLQYENGTDLKVAVEKVNGLFPTLFDGKLGRTTNIPSELWYTVLTDPGKGVFCKPRNEGLLPTEEKTSFASYSERTVREEHSLQGE